MRQDENQMSANKDRSSRPAPQVAGQNVKELGRKARARLEEERTKRAEIVQLAPDEAKLLAGEKQATKQRKASTTTTRNKRSAARGSETSCTIRTTAQASKRRRRSHQPLKGASASVPQNADMWMPDVSHLPRLKSKETRSSMVRLHGLPEGTTPVQIKKFFSGLQPERILVLLSCNATIPEWDAASDDDDVGDHNIPNTKKRRRVTTKEPQDRVMRYSSRFRVVVKFDSAPTAELATDRSGETIDVVVTSDQETEMTAVSRESLLRAAIGVTQLPKAHATYILQKLAIDTETTNTSADSSNLQNAGGKRPLALDKTLSNVEDNLLPHVDRILWMDAQEELNLSFKPYPWSFRDNPQQQEPRQEPKGFDTRLLSSNSSISESSQVYQSWVRHRNHLAERKEKLHQAFPFPSADLLDPILGHA